jgi:hypothetical protein
VTPLRREDDGGGWDEYRRLVLAALERLEGDIKTLDTKVDAVKTTLDAKVDVVKTAVTALQVKAGLIGALGGLLAGAIIGKLIH